MRENTKRFYKNSLLSLLGIFVFDTVAAGFVWILPGFVTARRAAILFCLCSVGLLFYGCKLLKPMPKAWQTVLSVAVVPIAVLAAFAGGLGLLATEIWLLPIVSSGNLLYLALPELHTLKTNTAVFYASVLLIPFLCMTIGAAVRRRLEEGEV